MPFTVIIPARFASTRLRGKPLLDIAGKPMIQHVYERACQSQAARVVIATDSESVQKVAADFGAEVCMTSDRHESGTDRLQEAASQLGLLAHDLVVNVQGDEPMIPPAVIDQVAVNLQRHAEASIATLCEPITELEQLLDPNIVKVVMDEQGLALYFSRAPIPWPRDEFRSVETLGSHKQLPPAMQFFRHIGIYGYRVQLLHDFVTWPLGKLEAVERLEQLRAMEHGHRIHVMPSVEAIPPGVDTERDLQRMREVLEGKI